LDNRVNVFAIIHGKYPSQSIGTEMFDECVQKPILVIEEQILEFMGVGKGATVGHFSARVDRWVGTFSLCHNLMGTPLPDCIELIKGQAQWINVFVTGRAIWILGVSFQFLTDGGFGAVRRIGFDRVDIGRRGRGRFSKKRPRLPILHDEPGGGGYHPR